ncbi:TPA: hypothetical protein DIV55_05545 [Patescibacteria group bacterium]|nr:hypothetical protein [Patescibacteria group bacterium]
MAPQEIAFAQAAIKKLPALEDLPSDLTRTLTPYILDRNFSKPQAQSLTELIEKDRNRLVRVGELMGYKLLNTYLQHYPPEVLGTLTEVFSRVTENLDAYATIFESDKYHELRDQERAFRYDKKYTTGMIGCVDGRVYALVFGMPLNMSKYREPAGLLTVNGLGVIADRELMQPILGKLEHAEGVAVVEFFQTHTALGIEGVIDDHYMCCGKVGVDLGDDLRNHPDNGVSWDLLRKRGMRQKFDNEINGAFGEKRAITVQEIYDHDSLGLVLGIDQVLEENPETFFTKENIINLEKRGKVVFTRTLFNGQHCQEFLRATGISRGSLSGKIGKPEFMLEVAETFITVRDRLQAQFGDDLSARFEQIYGESNGDHLAESRINALVERACWNVAFQWVSDWGDKSDHPLRHHAEFYIAHGPKAETNGLEVVPFLSSGGDGVLTAASLFGSRSIPYIASDITLDIDTDGGHRAKGRLETKILSFLNNDVLHTLQDLITSGDTQSARKFMSQFLDMNGKLRFVLLPPLMLQETSRRVLDIDTEFVNQVLPVFYDQLITLHMQLYNLEIDGANRPNYL